MEAQRGGRDTSLFVEEIDEDLLCAICHNVFVDPKEITSCGHIFCSSCISLWITRYFICELTTKDHRIVLSVDLLRVLHP